jgi:dethiobiotin synthetase
MLDNRLPGLFFTGTDTEVGKTFVAATVARGLVQAGYTVAAYKPVASGCERDERGVLVSRDAIELGRASGDLANLDAICPQRFEPPLTPMLAARYDRLEVDAKRLVDGFIARQREGQVMVVEGAGGLLSPLCEGWDNATLAAQLNLPVVVVVANRLGCINHARLTLEVAHARRLRVVQIVFSHPTPAGDLSSTSNIDLLRELIGPTLPITALDYGAASFFPAVDWMARAARE